MGALVCNYVTLKCAIAIPLSADNIFSLQASFFDALLPGLLPLALTLGCYKLLKKGMESYKVIAIVVALAIVGGLLGIF